ncbi:MAG: PH domain-containing protein [Phycisphaerales bacterium]|nr:MAG: PH domain-containing protein [Phycisphaerales bacterium]
MPTGFRAVPHATTPAAALPGEGAGDVPASRRGLLVGYLPEGEPILLSLRPSLLFILLYPLGTYAALIGVGWAVWLTLTITGIGPDAARVPWMTLIALLGRLAWACLEWLSRLYVLTDRRVITVAGVLRQGMADLPLSRIQHVAVYKSLRERVFGLGTIGFATAGTGTIEAAWRMLDQPVRTLDVIRRTLARHQGPNGTPGDGGRA